MKNLFTILLTLCIVNVADAKPRRTPTVYKTMSFGLKSNTISWAKYNKPFKRLTRLQKAGVRAAARNATAKPRLKYDPRCQKNILLGFDVYWDTKYIRWGQNWYKRYRKQQKRRKALIKKLKHQRRPTVTGGKLVIDYGKLRPCPECRKEKPVRHHKPVRVDKRRYDNRRYDNRRYVVINNYYGQDNSLQSPKAKPYEEMSRIVASGYFLNERMNGKQFSRSGGGTVELRLLGKWDSMVGRLELNVGGWQSKYATGGSFTGTGNSLNMLLGKTFGSTQVLGGLSADLLYGRDNYGDFKVDVSEGTVKAMLLVRFDSKWISVEGRAMVGGGNQNVVKDTPLFRADGSVQAELHLNKHFDLVAKGSIRYDRLKVQDVARDNVTVTGSGYFRILLGHGLHMELGFVGGKHFGNVNSSIFVQPKASLGWMF